MSGARIATLAPLAALMALAPPARAQAVAVISFREARVDAFDGMVRGPQRQVTVTLKGGNRIEDRDERIRGGGGGWGRRRGGGGGGPQVTTSESAFQQEFRPIAGRGAVGQWRVGANNTLVRITRHRTYTETITLSLVGRSSCQVSIVYARQRGAGLFINRGGRFASIQAVEPRCEISDR